VTLVVFGPVNNLPSKDGLAVITPAAQGTQSVEARPGRISMKRLSMTSSVLSLLVLLCSCGGGRASVHSPTTVPPTGPELKIPGNWELATLSTVGMPALAIGGSILQSGNTLNGAGHVDGSSCFKQPIAIGLTGTLTGGNVSLTSASFDGQVITLAGTITKKNGYPYQLTGTYTIEGGCASGD
jgi:hypothetical protein